MISSMSAISDPNWFNDKLEQFPQRVFDCVDIQAKINRVVSRMKCIKDGVEDEAERLLH